MVRKFDSGQWMEILQYKLPHFPIEKPPRTSTTSNFSQKNPPVPLRQAFI